MTTTAKLTTATAQLLLLLLGGGLWAQHGTAVFFDVLAASFVGCFL